jgi:hypothetical protein
VRWRSQGKAPVLSVESTWPAGTLAESGDRFGDGELPRIDGDGLHLVVGEVVGQIRAPSQYVCSLDNQRTDQPRGRVSRTRRLATSISVTSFEPTLKT